MDSKSAHQLLFWPVIDERMARDNYLISPCAMHRNEPKWSDCTRMSNQPNQLALLWNMQMTAINKVGLADLTSRAIRSLGFIRCIAQGEIKLVITCHAFINNRPKKQLMGRFRIHFLMQMCCNTMVLLGPFVMPRTWGISQLHCPNKIRNRSDKWAMLSSYFAQPPVIKLILFAYVRADLRVLGSKQVRPSNNTNLRMLCALIS